MSTRNFVVCDNCKRPVLDRFIIDNFGVCPKCGHHYKMSGRDRIEMYADKDSFVELNGELTSENKLNFPDYDAKIEKAKKDSGENEGVLTGIIKIDKLKTCIFVMDSSFMLGSMGHVIGEKITALFEYATLNELPVIGFCLSGGARMQEGIISLMQMAKTSAAVKKHSDKGLLYVSVLQNPTTGGVSASFAFLGDIILAEPNALICFAGPRVIEQTIGQKLPEGFQRAEFLLQKGFVDKIVPRNMQRTLLRDLLSIHGGKR